MPAPWLANVAPCRAGDTGSGRARRATPPFATYVQRRFYAPLGRRDCCHHQTVADNTRMSQVVEQTKAGKWRVDWRPGGAPTVPFVRGSGGMISSAADFAKFARLFVDRGRVGERQLLAEASVALASSDQISRLKTREGFGWAIDDDGFAHRGSDGTFVWCDLARRLVGMVLTQTQGEPALDPARQRFRREVAAAVPAAAQPAQRVR